MYRKNEKKTPETTTSGLATCRLIKVVDPIALGENDVGPKTAPSKSLPDIAFVISAGQGEIRIHNGITSLDEGWVAGLSRICE
jgi:hypothetical protein